MDHYYKQRQQAEAKMTKKATFKIKPNPETLLVWDEITRIPLKSKGEIKLRNEYWLRRMSDGDVIEITETTKKDK